MYPNQNDPSQVPPVAPVEPFADQPQPQQFTEPVVSPLVQPIEPVVFEPTVQPVPEPVMQPFQPPQPSQSFQMEQQLVTPPVQNPIFHSQPQQFIPPVLNNSVSFGQKKSGKKIFVIIGLLVVLAGLIAAAIIFLPNLLASTSLPLKEYSNDKYSILVPSLYKKEVLGDSASFKEVDEKSKDSIDLSNMSVSASAVEGVSKADMISQVDKMFNKETFIKLIASASDEKVENYKVDKSKINGNDARFISADAVKANKTLGSVYVIYIFTDEYVYTIMIQAHSSDPGLKANVSKIINSFEIK